MLPIGPKFLWHDIERGKPREICELEAASVIYPLLHKIVAAHNTEITVEDGDLDRDPLEDAGLAFLRFQQSRAFRGLDCNILYHYQQVALARP